MIFYNFLKGEIMDNSKPPIFVVEKIYIKDLSVEVPNAPEIFLENATPQIAVQLNTKSRVVQDGLFEVVLTVSISATLGGEKQENGETAPEHTVFLVEIGQAGVFKAENIPAENIEPLLAITCPTVLFPYVRETAASAITKAGFPPLVLQPVNFEALYMEKLEAEKNAAKN